MNRAQAARPTRDRRVPGAVLGLLTLAAAVPAARAEAVYVIEQLVVSIASAPDSDSERVAQVKSGDKLELLEREGEEAHVRLPSGKEGWIKASYLSSEEPLQLRLTARTAEMEKLKQEDDKLRQDVSRLESELANSRRAAAATATAAASTAPVPAAPTAASRQTAVNAPSVTSTTPAGSASSAPTSDTALAANGATEPLHEPVFLRQPDRPGQTSWPFLLGIAAVMLLVGFALGWATLDRKIRQKYGGLRIY